VLGVEHLKPIADRNAGVTIRNAREKRSEAGMRTALSVCQAMIIAITVVLPAPVAIFTAMRNSSGLASALAASIERAGKRGL
jgi:hypothetical protein